MKPSPSEHVIDLPSLAKNDLLSMTKALILLTKPRLAFFTILTAVASYAATAESLGWIHALLATLGISLSAGGALSLNQWLERHLDAQMDRTRLRPLPAKQISPYLALAFSTLLSLSGIHILATSTTLLAAGYAAATILIYGFVYTPLKRHTRWATEIGAISGALPPLIGTAASGNPSAPIGLSLFAIILVWQMPHFYAIGWRFRDEYTAAGFKLLSTTDADGTKTASWTLGYSALLFGLPIALYTIEYAQIPLLIASLIAGLDLVHAAWKFRKKRSTPNSKRLFLSTIRYLPILLIGAAISELI